MQTDISLFPECVQVAANQGRRILVPRGKRSSWGLTLDTRKIVIDCKFTPEATQHHYEAETLRSSHVFQINAYMDNLEGKWADTCEMMLLYPTVDSPLSADYTHEGHKIRIRTINLDQPWQNIHEDLLAMVA